VTEFFRTRAALVRATVASLILVGVLFAFVFPTRTWLAQRAKAADAQSELTLLRHQTAELDGEAARLRSDREVERVARARFGLVMPGEQAWAVVPPPTTTTTTTTTPLPQG
jgi:cell division protein FtsB